MSSIYHFSPKKLLTKDTTIDVFAFSIHFFAIVNPLRKFMDQNTYSIEVYD